MEIHKYPHIFKPLKWWEERKLKDMPTHLKVKDITEDENEEKFYRLGIDVVFNYYDGEPYLLQYATGGGTLLEHCEDIIFPATQEEYNAQQKQTQ